VKTDQDSLTDADIAAFFQNEDDNGKRHLFCRECDPEVKVALCGYRRKEPQKKPYPAIAVLVLWPLMLWRLRTACKRCKELAFPHAALHVDKVL
jgi:hypothetical protein